MTLRGFDVRDLVDVELQLLVVAQQQQEALCEQSHSDFLAVAPQPLIAYVWALDPEVKADPAFAIDSKLWFQERHPAFHDSLGALEYAVHHRVEPRLEYVQGVVIKFAEWRLGWWFAEQRAAGVRGPCYDGYIRQLAAEALLGWSAAEGQVAWLEPQLFLDRWRVAHTADQDVLARAGLHVAELELLAA